MKTGTGFPVEEPTTNPTTTSGSTHLDVCLRRLSRNLTSNGYRFNSFILLNEDEPQEQVEIDVLMPNGTLISLEVAQASTFSEIKEVNHPFF